MRACTHASFSLPAISVSPHHTRLWLSHDIVLRRRVINVSIIAGMAACYPLCALCIAAACDGRGRAGIHSACRVSAALYSNTRRHGNTTSTTINAPFQASIKFLSRERPCSASLHAVHHGRLERNDASLGLGPVLSSAESKLSHTQTISL